MKPLILLSLLMLAGCGNKTPDNCVRKWIHLAGESESHKLLFVWGVECAK